MKDDDVSFEAWLIFFGLLAFFFMLVLPACSMMGSLISTGEGSYQGVLVETRHHGLFFKTYGVHLKTGENSNSFEDFCVTDKSLFEKISTLPRDKKVIVIYDKKFTTPPWACDHRDTNDIIRDVRVVD